jgi:hypothetical protein
LSTIFPTGLLQQHLLESDKIEVPPPPPPINNKTTSTIVNDTVLTSPTNDKNHVTKKPGKINPVPNCGGAAEAEAC